ncbi:hypothetical protein B0H17DRAFT_1037306 [Mycena rosella]|uniref:Uncharacterized protein n=1 Tax=Mycena rosella TaxID=1033263 RepID=A0AAD7M947_MYCRO|nr:hypothetical protein B0H17DRAFT_1037306 [Mycena rosella]
MLATLCFLLPLPLTYAATKIIDSSDPSIEFSPGWSQEYSQTTEDMYMQTDIFPASLTATLPSSASSVSFVGYKRAGGSAYGYCFDCEGAAEATLVTVNGTDPSVTNDSMALEVRRLSFGFRSGVHRFVSKSTLFSVDIDPSVQHTLTVYNLPTDELNTSSEITFDHLEVSVDDDEIDTDTGPTSTDSIPFSSTSLTQSSATLSTSAPSSAPPSAGTGSSSAPSSAPTAGPGSSTSIHDPVLQQSASASSSAAASTANPAPSSSAAPDQAATGVSKSLITGISILVVVFAASVIVGLVVFVRQRRQRSRDEQRGRDSFQSPEPPLSPTGSLIPIMPPPQMRTASLNPFSDPETLPEFSPLDRLVNSSLMQRRMESRSTSPGSAPTIPLPDLPLDRPVNRMVESRGDSPASAFSSRNSLWITRPVQTPVNAQFSAV